MAIQSSKVSNKKGSRLCSGCGVEVIRGGARGSSKNVGMIAGEEAVAETGATKKQQKKMRYVDVSDRESSSFLCDRCKALKSNNVWKAYDALYDVSPEVFSKQLRHIVSRRRFGMCILVVDSTDPEHSAMKNLRKSIGKVPCILVFTKSDLVPRMNRIDQKRLTVKISRLTGGTKFIGCYGVSSVTGKGIVDLAEGVLREVQGRDVFVVGSANVGKSTLVQKLAGVIADAVYMKGKQGKRRRDLAHNLPVTGSPLPGTTLQAVRIPCFSKPGHALWDTPGVINTKAVQYSLFPSHLMEPLTRPEVIPIPTKENELSGDLSPGDTLLIEANWMEEGDDEEPCVLARLDMAEIESGRTVFSRAFLHPSLRVRVVPTERAPDHATIPKSFIRQIHDRMRNTKIKDEYSLPLKPYIAPDIPEGKVTPKESEWNDSAGKFFVDICFASLGWISLTHLSRFAVIPHVVKGSIFSKRMSLYPLNIHHYQEEQEEYDEFHDEESIQRRLRDAAREGRHQKKKESYADFDDDEWF